VPVRAPSATLPSTLATAIMDANAAGQLYKGLEGLLKLGVQFAPVPGLVPAVDVLCALLIVCQNVQTNKCATAPKC
jgi:hypothetical protein